MLDHIFIGRPQLWYDKCMVRFESEVKRGNTLWYESRNSRSYARK